jgi:Tol biopolymer transport system component
MASRFFRRSCAVALLVFADASTSRAQDYTVNLPFPPYPALGGGDVGRFVLSPDGARVAYVADAETPDVPELFAVALDGARVAHKLNPPLNPFGGIRHFQFTPDSARVLLIVDDEEFQEYQLYSALVDGTMPPVRLNLALPEGCDVGHPDAGFRLLVGANDRVVFVGDLEIDGVFQLYSAPADGSTPPTRLNGTLAADRDVDPAGFWLTPDGTRVLYLSDEGSDAVMDLWSVPTDGSTASALLLPTYTPTQGIGGDGGAPLQFTPDGSEIVFRADLDRNDVYELFRLPVTGGQVRFLMDFLPDHADAKEFMVTPDGDHVIVRVDRFADEVYELWSTRMQGSSAPVRLSGPMAADGDVDGSGLPEGPFQISPDGARVIFRADQAANERFDLFSAPVDGSAPTVNLTTLLPSRRVTTYRISPDSSWVVYLANQRNLYFEELFSVPIGGGTPRRLNSPLMDVRNRIQRDFRIGLDRVAFRVDSPIDEVYELFSAPLHGFPPRARDLSGEQLPRGPTRINLDLDSTADVDSGITVTNDGQRLLYVADQESPGLKELFLSLLDASQAPQVQNGALTAGPAFGDVSSFGFAGERMLYSAPQDDPRFGELYSVSFESVPSRVKLHDHELDGGTVLQPRVSPDGLHVAYRADVHERGQYELMVTPVDGSAAPLELSGTIIPVGGDVLEDFVFTADSARIVFGGNLESDGVLELYSAPIDGGASHVKLNAPLVAQGNVVAFQCSPDGGWVIYRADQDTDEKFELYSVPSDGGAAPQKLNGPLIADGDVLDAPGAIRITPDSAHVVFVADASDDGVYEIFAGPTDGSAPAWRLHAALGSTRDAYVLAVTPDGQTVLFRTDEELHESFDLYAAPIDASVAPVRLSQPFPLGDGVVRCEVTPNGDRAIYIARRDGSADHQVFSVPVDGSALPIEIGESVPSSYDRINDVFVAPGGEHVVYVVDGSRHELYTAWVDGSEEAVELAQFDAFADELDMTIDGYVVYRAREVAAGPIELFRVPVLGTSPPERLHAPLAQGREVTAFQIGAAGDRVLFRGDLLADERYELFLTFLDQAQ